MQKLADIMLVAIAAVVVGVCGCGSAAQHGLSPDPACDRYLACTSQTMPATFSAQLAAYGPSSPCWTSPVAAQACASACTSLFTNIGAQCPCDANEDCPTVAPHCSALMRRCAECGSTADCANLVLPSGLVDPFTRFCRVPNGWDAGTCVSGCGVDADCPAETPHCRYQTATAGACSK